MLETSVVVVVDIIILKKREKCRARRIGGIGTS